MTFAGFWVDGAVRKPEARHAGPLGTVVVVDKENNEHGAELERWKSVGSDRYWLDTTPRESLTPEELFSVVKVLFPEIEHVKKDSWAIDYLGDSVKVDWDSLIQYPPPAEPQWVRVTRENVGQYLFCECRFRDIEAQPWRVGKISGWDDQDGCCLVNSDFKEEMPIMQWCIVEVQV